MPILKVTHSLGKRFATVDEAEFGAQAVLVADFIESDYFYLPAELFGSSNSTTLGGKVFYIGEPIRVRSAFWGPDPHGGNNLCPHLWGDVLGVAESTAGFSVYTISSWPKHWPRELK